MREHGAGGSTFSDWWAYKFEVNDAIPYNATLLNNNGVLTKDSTMNLFPHLDTFEPTTIKDIQGSISGPILPGKLSIFASISR